MLGIKIHIIKTNVTKISLTTYVIYVQVSCSKINVINTENMHMQIHHTLVTNHVLIAFPDTNTPIEIFYTMQ